MPKPAPGSMLPWRISVFPPGIHMVFPKQVQVNRPETLDKMFRQPATVSRGMAKGAQRHWSPALYPMGTGRSKTAVELLTALVYDLDSVDLPPASAADRLKKEGICYAVHTTWSHQVEDPHYRVVLWLDRPVDPTGFPQVWRGGVRWLQGAGIVGVDPQCKDSSRTYYLPCKRPGLPYEGYLELTAPPLVVDRLMELGRKQQKAPPPPPQTGEDSGLLPTTPLTLEGGNTSNPMDLIAKGPGKYKCHCPFEAGSSFGSAFLRVTTDGRALLVCTSPNHTHAGAQFWMKKDGKATRAPARSLKRTQELLEELPPELVQGIERRFVYSYVQGVFFEWLGGAWSVGSALRKEQLVDHFIGLLPESGSQMHARALIDRLLQLQVSGMTYDSMAGPVVRDGSRRYMNLYARPSVRPAAAPFPTIQQMVSVLCGHDKIAMKWLANWCAALVQRPERRGMVAVLVLSPLQGIGKTMFGRILARIIGERNSAVIGDQTLEDDFNSSYATKLFVLADEVAVGRTRKKNIIAKIKAAVTDDRIPLRSMYTAPTEIENRMSWWMTSNAPRPLLIEQNDRRFTILRPTKVDTAYRKLLNDSYEEDGTGFTPSFDIEIAGFSQFLLNQQVNHSLASKPFSSLAKKQIQEASRPNPEAFVEEIRTLTISSVLTAWPPSVEHSRQPVVSGRAIPLPYLYGSFITWCQQRGVRPEPEPVFRLTVSAVPEIQIKTVRAPGQTIRAYVGLNKLSGSNRSGKLESALPSNVVELN
jgi:hypothetical protein